MSKHSQRHNMKKQQGLVAVIVTIGLFCFFGVAVLAIDINHALTNRTKLQNSVDAAALAAAYVLDRAGIESDALGDAETLAKDTVIETLNKMAVSTGNAEIDIDSNLVSVTFSDSPLGPFTANISNTYDQFVRVSVSGLALKSFFIQIFNIDKKLSASAVAGRSAGGGSCNLVPMAVCADPNASEITTENVQGYTQNNVYALKLTSNNSAMGPGNFQLLDYDTDAKLSEQLAGSYDQCADPGNTVVTKPGNTIGPVGKGLNARFGDSSNSLDLPDSYASDTDQDEATLKDQYVNASVGIKTIADVFEKIVSVESDQIATSIQESGLASTFTPFNAPNTLDDSYAEYKGNGMRVLAVPIIDCTVDVASGSLTASGKSEFQVKDIGCFFLLAKAPTNSGSGEDVYGEFLTECPVSNVLSNSTSNSSGTYRIVLYDDPLNEES